MSLTARQRRFLSIRAITLTDEEAAETAEVCLSTVRGWLGQTEFFAAYSEALADIVAASRQFTYALLDKANARLEEMLDATKINKQGDEVNDWEARGKAIDLLLTSSGIKSSKVDVNAQIGVQVINDAIPRPAD